MVDYDLSSQYDGRKSFYGKARVYIDGDKKTLRSYNTNVCQIEGGVAKVFGTYSKTTLRHIREFLRQNGFKAESQEQIINDYP